MTQFLRFLGHFFAKIGQILKKLVRGNFPSPTKPTLLEYKIHNRHNPNIGLVHFALRSSIASFESGLPLNCFPHLNTVHSPLHDERIVNCFFGKFNDEKKKFILLYLRSQLAGWNMNPNVSSQPELLLHPGDHLWLMMG